MKKGLCLILAAAMLCSAGTSLAATDQPMLQTETERTGEADAAIMEEGAAIPSGGQQVLLTFDDGEPTDYFEIGNARKMSSDFSNVRDVFTADYDIEGIQVNNSDTVPDVSYQNEGANASLIVEYDVMFEDVVQGGSVAYLKTTDRNWYGTYTTCATGFMFDGKDGKIKVMDKPGGSWITSGSAAADLKDHYWYHIRDVIKVTDGAGKLSARHDVYINGELVFQGLGFISSNYYKFPAVNSLVFEKDANQDRNYCTMYLDNLLFYKTNQNCTQSPTDYGEFLSGIRNAQAELYTSTVGDKPEDYSEEVYQERKAVIYAASQQYYDANKTVSSLKTVLDQMNAQLYTLEKNGEPLQIVECGVRYYNASGGVVTVPIIAARAEAYVVGKTSRYADEGGEDFTVIGMLLQNQQDKSKPKMTLSSETCTLLPGSRDEVSVTFDLSGYSVMEKSKLGILAYAIDNLTNRRILVHSDGYVPKADDGDWEGKGAAGKDENGGYIEFSVTSSAGDDVMLIVHKPDAEDSILYADQGLTDDAGKANFKVYLPEDRDGVLAYSVYSSDHDAVKRQQIHYFTEDSVDAALEQIYQAESEDAAFLLAEEYQDGIGIDSALFDVFCKKAVTPTDAMAAVRETKYTYATRKDFVDKLMSHLPIDSVNKIRDTEVLAELLKPAGKISVAEALKISNQTDELKKQRYARFLTETHQSDVLSLIAKQAGSYTAENFSEHFHEMCFIAELKAAANAYAIEALIKNSGDLLENDAEYLALNDAEQFSAAEILYQKRNSGSAADFDKSIKEAVESVRTAGENQQTPSVRPGGLRGGGGGGGGVSSGSSTFKPEENKQEERTAEKPIEQVRHPFRDMTEYDWARDAVSVLFSKGVISGISADTFAPGQEVKREEFVKMAMTLFGFMDETAGCDFADVEDSAWYYPYVASAQKCGIVQGVSETEFGIGQTMTREQLVTLVYRAALQAGINFHENREYIAFDDHQDISDYAQEAVEAMAGMNIVEGSDNLFLPQQNCTRAEAAKLLYGTYVLLLESERGTAK